jgi:hypothetical protein
MSQICGRKMQFRNTCITLLRTAIFSLNSGLPFGRLSSAASSFAAGPLLHLERSCYPKRWRSVDAIHDSTQAIFQSLTRNHAESAALSYVSDPNFLRNARCSPDVNKTEKRNPARACGWPSRWISLHTEDRPWNIRIECSSVSIAGKNLSLPQANSSFFTVNNSRTTPSAVNRASPNAAMALPACAQKREPVARNAARRQRCPSGLHRAGRYSADHVFKPCAYNGTAHMKRI